MKLVHKSLSSRGHGQIDYIISVSPKELILLKKLLLQKLPPKVIKIDNQNRVLINGIREFLVKVKIHDLKLIDTH